MRGTVNIGNTASFEVKNEAFTRLNFDFDFTADAVNVSLVDKGVDLDQIDVSLTLFQNGQKIKLYSGKLMPIATVSHMALGDYESIRRSASGHSNGLVLTTKDVAVKEHRICRAMIDFGAGYILKQGDKLVVDVDYNTASMHADCDTVASLLFHTEQAITNQYVTVMYDVYSIPATKQNFTEHLGDNVQAIYSLNLDKITDEETDKIITDFSLESDRLNIDKSYQMLKADRKLYLGGVDQFGGSDRKFNQNFQLVGMGEADKVKIDLTIDTSNATDGNNYLVVRKFMIDPTVTQKAQNRDRKHRAYTMAKG